MIAYKDKDLEGDAWSERAFLFKNREDVKKFFIAGNPLLLDVYTDEDDRILHDFEVNESSKTIVSVTFRTEYAGKVKIVEMAEGFLIP